MPNSADNDLYDIRITVRAKLKRWRLNDQSIEENRKWIIAVYDEVKEDFVNLNECTRPGEESYISNIEVL